MKKAWLIKCVNASSQQFSPNIVTINPNCLRVDSATIFFMSFSFSAKSLAILVVKLPRKRRISLKLIFLNKLDIRIIM